MVGRTSQVVSGSVADVTGGAVATGLGRGAVLASVRRGFDPIVLGWAGVGLYVVLLSRKVWLEARRGVAPLGGDQAVIGTMVAKDLDPELFGRDYLLHDPAVWDFYTPAARWLVRELWVWLGGYEQALAALVPVLLVVYLVGMYRVVRLVAGNRWVALGIALVSTAPRAAVGSEFWGVAGVETVVPRSLFLALAPWLFGAFLARRPGRLGTGILIGGLVGALANLHPVSGLAVLEILGLLIVLSAGGVRGAVHEAGGLAVAALVAASPTVVAFARGLGGIARSADGVDFQRFASVVQWRFGTLFPFKSFAFGGDAVSPATQVLAAWGYAAFLVVVMVLWLVKYRRQAADPGAWLLVWLAQLPLAYLVTGRNGMALVLAAVAYGALWAADEVDRDLTRLLAVVVGLAWLGSYGLALIWETTGWWSLTVLVGEHSRVARFVYLPLYLVLARLSARALAEAGGTAGRWSLVFAVWACVLWTPREPHGAAVALLALWFSCRGPWRGAAWWAVVATGVGAGVLGWTLGRQVDPVQAWAWVWVWVAAGSLASGFRAAYGPGAARPARVASAVLAGLAVLGAGVASWARSGPTPFVAPLRGWITPGDADLRPTGARDLAALASWARHHTGQQALFYFDSHEFRFRARRGITHAWKDLGLAAYSRGMLVPLYERHQTLEAARRDPTRLVRCAAALGADFAVVESGSAVAAAPIAYRNDTYIVYGVAGPAGPPRRPDDWSVPPECG